MSFTQFFSQKKNTQKNNNNIVAACCFVLRYFICFYSFFLFIFIGIICRWFLLGKCFFCFVKKKNCLCLCICFKVNCNTAISGNFFFFGMCVLFIHKTGNSFELSLCVFFLVFCIFNELT